MATVHSAHPPIEILPPPVGSIEDRERRLIEAVVALTRSLRDERDRLAGRLRDVELELSRLTSSLEVGTTTTPTGSAISKQTLEPRDRGVPVE